MPILATPGQLLRLTDAAYADGVSALRDAANAAAVAHAIFDQEGDTPDPMGLSALFVSWGQFTDHDLDLTLDNSGELVFVDGLVGPLERSQYDETTGIDSPREHLNSITPEIDASQVYGSTATRTAELRSFEGGRMLVSDDPNGDLGLLPFTTEDGQMAGDSDLLFLAGDVRANENTGLTVLHTLFVREHNHWADRLATEHPDWTDDQLFLAARSIVEAEMQKITYQDWLPHLVGDALGAYEGHDPEADGQIATEFSTAAFRFGHTMISSLIARTEEDGSEYENGNLAVADAFFNIDPLAEDGIDALLRGQAGQLAQAFDTKVVDDLNFFLELGNGLTGFSLPALNILRGRDHGIGTYTDVRAQLLGDIDPETLDSDDFSVITSDQDVQDQLRAAYGTVDQVDLWVGGLAEDKIDGTQMGAVFTAIIVDQFSRTRAADETFGALSPELGAEIAAEIAETTLGDIIQRNSSVEHLQSDVFEAALRIGVDGRGPATPRTDDALLLVGGGSADVLLGRDGDDALFGGDGGDRLLGRSGDDELYGGSGRDVHRGGDGSDVLLGDAGDDVLCGDAGNDLIDGGEGDDRLIGGSGNDDMAGGLGNDRVIGGDGDDILTGGEGRDRLCGSSGDDWLDGGADNDVLTGGDGSDTFVFGVGGGRDMIHDFEAGIDRIAFVGFTAADLDGAMRQHGSTVRIDLGADQLFLKHTSIDDLTGADFDFL